MEDDPVSSFLWRQAVHQKSEGCDPHSHPSVSVFSRLLDCFKCRVKRCNQVIYVFRADGKANGVRFDTLVQQLFICQLTVGGCIGMDDQGLDIRHIGQQRENGQIVDKLLRRLTVSLNLKGEDAPSPVREVLFVQRVARLRRECRMMHGLHLRMVGEVVHDLQSILYMALNAERQGLQPLQEDKGVEGRQG